MKKYKVYQLPHLRGTELDKEYCDATLDGEVAVSLMPSYELRGIVEARDIYEVSYITNTTVHRNCPAIEILAPDFHSIGVGDIVANEDGKMWVAVAFGFEKLELVQGS